MMMPRKRQRHTVYFENIVNNFIFIEEADDGANIAGVDAEADAVTSTTAQNSQNNQINIDT